LSLRNQRRIAAEILRIGENRVWIDPNRIENVESAITREDIKRLIHEKTIRPIQEKGVSRARARVLHEKKKKGLRSGPGSRSGSPEARVSRKAVWISKIRALRSQLHKLRDDHSITDENYRQLYVMAGSGLFKSVAELERYIDAHNLRRRR